MTPTNFPGCNVIYGPPKGVSDEQVRPIPACQRRVEGGSLDGAEMVIVAWMPTAEELKRLQEGAPLFITMIGGLMPHFPSTSLEEASRPS